MELLAETWSWLSAAEQWEGADGIPARTWEHLRLAVSATVVALLLAVPPAVWLAHRRAGEFLASAVVNIGRAVPSFGVIVIAALLFLRAGIPVRFWSTMVALVALALPPLFTNAYAGVRGVDPATLDAARGMGLTDRQLLGELEVPLAVPLIVTGLRISFVQVLATATLGAIIGPGGGLGRYIVDGFARGPGGYTEVLGGAVLVALLTIAGERALGWVERRSLPTGVARLVDART